MSKVFKIRLKSGQIYEYSRSDFLSRTEEIIAMQRIIDIMLHKLEIEGLSIDEVDSLNLDIATDLQDGL